MEQIDEHSSALLREESIRIAWRLQHGVHGIEVGMRGDIESFLQARDRLSILLGGQSSASELVQTMMKRSLFVEEARRKIGFKGTSIDISIFDRLFIEPVEDIIDAWYLSFRTAIDAWKEAWLERGAAFADDVPSGMTRFRYVQYLCDQSATTQMEKLQWAYLASFSIATEGNLGNVDCKPLTHARTPSSGGWPGGIFKPEDTTLDDTIAALIIEKATLDDYKNGMELTKKQLIDIFGKFGIEEIDPNGESLDPNYHQAMSMIETEDEANKVLSVMQKGYKLNERVLRPALVSVSKQK